MSYSVKKLLDSVTTSGIRGTTFELRYPRMIHSELLTHRLFSRNASSSRAIPVERLIQDVIDDPAMPFKWGRNQPGMQAGEDWDAPITVTMPINDEPWDSEPATPEQVWLHARDMAVAIARGFAHAEYHKQCVNRLLEPFAHINVVVTSTDFNNFFALRYHKDADPTIAELARLMWEEYNSSSPEQLLGNNWHLPYIRPIDRLNVKKVDLRQFPNVMRRNLVDTIEQELLIRVSVARCARVSYKTHDGRETTLEEDLKLYNRLLTADIIHASPAEHQFKPDYQGLMGWQNPKLHGNLYGVIQYRKLLPGEFQKDFPLMSSKDNKPSNNPNGYLGKDRWNRTYYPSFLPRFEAKYAHDRIVREFPSWRNPRTNERHIDPEKERWHEDFNISNEITSMQNRNVNYSVNAYDSSDIFAADSMRFINQLGNYNNYSTRVKYKTKGTLNDVLNMVIDGLKEVTGRFNLGIRYEFHGQNTIYVFAYGADLIRLMVRIDDYLPCTIPYEEADRDITLITQGLPELVMPATEYFDEHKVEFKQSRIEWKFMAGGRQQSKTLMLEDPVKPLDAFYPYLSKGVEEYFDSFMASDSNILIFLGEAGAGKTSLIRYLLHSRGLNTTVTYDEDLLKSDGLYVDYLMDDDMNMLVIEDAELILTDRKNAGNKVMSKLLNVSDGLVKVFNKKMVFTANVSDIDEIDEAILRPGRAYDVVKFRKLTFKEAVAAAEAANVPAPTEEREYSLAEVFKLKEVAEATRNVEKADRSFGFGFTGGR